ncbi:MAG: nicotinate-nucleotide adenylyltransferase [Acidobacteriota bacterium]
MAGERIGVYGGTFDPLHIGHFRIAEALVDAFQMDRLFFVPAHVPPHKRGIRISAAYHRHAMIVLATERVPRLHVSAIELEAPARPYTIETLGRFGAVYPDAQLFFVMGDDSFGELHTWRDYGQIIREYGIIVAARAGSRPPGDKDRDNAGDKDLMQHLTADEKNKVIDLRGHRRPEVSDLTGPRIFLTDLVSEDVSATQIRQAAANGQPIENLVPPGVAGYIEKYGLYSGKHEQSGNE